jgi:hypothetical protein
MGVSANELSMDGSLFLLTTDNFFQPTGAGRARLRPTPGLFSRFDQTA